MDKITFCSTFTHGPILGCLVVKLQIASLRSLQLTCRQYGDLYNFALTPKWNIDSALKRFVQHPKAFRHELQESNAVVSGSVALQFFDSPSTWQAGDMDVYVMQGVDTKAMHEHLVTTQQYEFEHSRNGDDVAYPIPAIEEVRTYKSIIGPMEHIQLIVFRNREGGYDTPYAHDDVVEGILSCFHSTTVLNLLTATEAVSLYPQTTFITRKAYVHKPYKEPWKHAVDKYVERGWTLADVLPSERNKVMMPVRKVRRLGDQMCWRIPYERSAQPKGKVVVDTFASIMWLMEEFEEKHFHHDEETGRLNFVSKSHNYSISLLRNANLDLYWNRLASLPASHRVHRAYFNGHGDPSGDKVCNCGIRWYCKGIAGEARLEDLRRECHRGLCETDGQMYEHWQINTGF